MKIMKQICASASLFLNTFSLDVHTRSQHPELRQDLRLNLKGRRIPPKVFYFQQKTRTKPKCRNPQVYSEKIGQEHEGTQEHGEEDRMIQQTKKGKTRLKYTKE